MEEPAKDLTKFSFALRIASSVWNTSLKNFEILHPYDFFFISSKEIELETNSNSPEFSLRTMIS